MSDPRLRGLDAVTAYLTERGVDFEVVEHPLTNTAEAEARAARDLAEAKISESELEQGRAALLRRRLTGRAALPQTINQK